MKGPKTMGLIKPITPLTRSSSRNITSDYKLAEETLAQGQPAIVEKTYTSPGEGEKTIKWLNKQLRDAQDQTIQLRESKRESDLRFHENLRSVDQPSIMLVKHSQMLTQI